ncbi:conserved Plasmodium protein, unknown function [Plasmodium malariae]|uniref:Uncharacterized protein n=2 Tax=Plasmodium (Plasmodium) TaxID=418103 RepID=A0A1A8WUW3_PLAMA|nr:conserved Plasmodium protein, unknown function [Plasmodium malariae]SBS96747.1 conserved Plasmodium protein, unknown function [Plasmodium malariae]SBT86699.1 conserved Plasmodium protein, unknown function [Plasmodium malariae]
MQFVKYFEGNFLKIVRRNFSRDGEKGLKPSSLRVKSVKKNFNDIINKYFPNRVLKRKNKEPCKSYRIDEKFYLSAKVERQVKFLPTGYEMGARSQEGEEYNDEEKNTDETNERENNGVQRGNNSNDIVKWEGEHICKEDEKRKDIQEISKEEYNIQKYKNKIHKRIWMCLKRNNEKEFENCYNMLVNYPLKDEVSYSILLHGNLIISDGNNIQNSFKVLNEMKEKKVHCSLIRFNERLLHSYYELTKLNAKPNKKQWLKVLRTVWFTSALIKARRQRFILRKVKNIKDDNSVALSKFKNTFNIHNLEMLYAENRDPLIGEGKGDMSVPTNR